jgi:DNA-directed RNA polymerase subunit beta
MLTIKSDDLVGRTQAYSAIIQGNEIPESTVPETFKLLVRQLNGLGIGLEALVSEEEEADTEDSAEIDEDAVEAIFSDKGKVEEGDSVQEKE